MDTAQLGTILKMSIHLQRFIERLQGFEARGAKDFIMPIAYAKGMHADLTRLLLELTNLKEAVISAREDEVITVKVGGGSF
jgi:hypothetical protein